MVKSQTFERYKWKPIITGEHFGPSETRLKPETPVKIFIKTEKGNKIPLKMEKLPRIRI